MSPEDAARYIANNETKFSGEFSERAKASGLNGLQILAFMPCFFILITLKVATIILIELRARA